VSDCMCEISIFVSQVDKQCQKKEIPSATVIFKAL
jgi:hypothetical protein